VASLPYALQPAASRPAVEQLKRDDADFYARLAAAGFKLTHGDDESGIGPMYARRGSGYYIDVGASELIADGRIKLCTGGVARLTEDAVVLDDGSVLAADLVVYATGYGSMNQWAAALISPEVADKVGKCWGLGSQTAKDPGRGRASCATCGSPRRRTGCGSTAATSPSRGTIRATWRCSSRRGSKASPRRCMEGARCIIGPDPREIGRPRCV
jgi:putative flavoprotein involved in K+ transport